MPLYILKYTMANIIPIIQEEKPVPESVADVGSSKDWAMVKTMQDFARSKPQKNLTPVTINAATRKTKLALLVLPEWGVYFPPYNLSRLSAVARSAGYEVKVYDVNIDAWHKLRNALDFDPWDPSKEFLWEKAGTYLTQLHTHLEPIYNSFIDQLEEYKPDVVGFTLYYTNEIPTNRMMRDLQKRLPNAKYIAGGPQANTPNPTTMRQFDYIVQGEGEQLLLTVLDSIEEGKTLDSKVLVQPKTVRLDLDSMPFPDYTDYDMTRYTIPNGNSSEISRGCVAKCVFCTEVHFWKYRGRQSGSILDEVQYQYDSFGLDFIWFIDSLVNGNLKELHAFVLGVAERKLPIRWQGYARCDTRMDAEYFRDLAAGGCHMLNYGVESGSQRVLDVMQKKITREAIENNLRDGGLAGIANSTNWIIGFPSEKTMDLADTLTILYRIRNYNLINVSGGVSMVLSPGAEVTDNQDAFGISPCSFLGAWTTKDLTNTKLHRMIRQKSFQIFGQHLGSDKPVDGLARPSLRKHYEIEYDASKMKVTIPYEEFNYNIIPESMGPFQDSLVNEIWPLLRTFWRAMGPYKITLRNTPETDMAEWGSRLAATYTSTHKFEIDAHGKWEAHFVFKFVHDEAACIQNFGNKSFELDWFGSGYWT
jgi:anaerobic magnesium-protoporphyrin IX monomethyl ester cyclase